ncbi:MAG: OprO/OprP family phosphate-selective porin [Dysgonamonadaceae bacterium]|jgi:hypothetical protein|nr:OprO/OprP family phosphate-selective porin [Dysgonamonadaceae bacterium]
MNKKPNVCAIAAVLLIYLFLSENIRAQKISGYIQGQYQWGEPDATLKVGAPNENPAASFNRIGIRRARLKVLHEEGLLTGSLEIDVSDKGVSAKEACLSIKDPWWDWCRLQAGIFTRPFGHELSYASVNMESPERSILCQTLFPDEKDMGVMLLIQPAQSSPWNFLKFAGGWFAGNGVKMETDNRRDFIGHLSANPKMSRKIQIAGGLSYYKGSVYQGTETVYTMVGDGFVLNQHPDNRGKYSLREYFGADLELSITNAITGQSQIRAEYLFGRQPGSLSDSKSPNASTLPVHNVYNRDFAGGYVMFVQELGKWPLSAVLKYDWYDPNTGITGKNIGLNHTSAGDVAFRHFGAGLLWRITADFRVQTYYEINKNETADFLTAGSGDLRDNVFTLRLQYKF